MGEYVSHTLQFTKGSVTLNPEQYKVVTADPHEHQRILASAGSGKTTTITARIAWLLTHTGCTADQIVLLTFSRNAAREMLHRVRRLIGPVSLWAGTFHSLARNILSTYGQDAHADQYFIDELPVRWSEWLRTERGRKWVSRLRYIVVDEFQDINAIQWRLLEGMRHIGARAIIVGDDAQNIYTWRGSSIGFLLDLHQSIPGVQDYQLRQNYRSTEAIVAVANRIMKGISTLPWKKQMIAHRTGGTKPDVLFFWRQKDEYYWVAKSILEIQKNAPHATIVILARNNIDLYRMEEVLLHEGVCNRFLASERAEQLESVPATQGCVDLATFHGSKGLEWDYTFLIGLRDDSLPSRKGSQDIVGERRLFYVACTRARSRLFLTYHGNERLLSRFVREIGYSYLTFHGLAKYALSDWEIGDQVPTLGRMLEGLDGVDWKQIRALGMIPDVSTAIELCLFPPGETWKVPEWSDPKDFEAFLRLWIQRWLLEARGWKDDYQDPLRERMIFTIRIFQEDRAFWETWREEIDLAVRTFFADTTRLLPAEYGDIEKWASGRGLPWGQPELVAATRLIAKLRGQLRPLRFENINLDDFTIGPTRIVVPTEYRGDVMRSWRRFLDKSVPWRECLLDIWRLSCLEQVSEGRNAGLFRVLTVKDGLADCIPFLESLEMGLLSWLRDDFDDTTEFRTHPEIVPEGLQPISSDCILGRKMIRITGERKPDLAFWVETWILAYLFSAQGNEPFEQIEVIHPFTGIRWTVSKIPMLEIRRLYQEIESRWKQKQG